MTATLSPSGPPPLVVRIRPAPSFEPPADDTRHPDDHPDCAGQLALFTSLHAEIDEPVSRRTAHRPAAPGRSQWTRPAATAKRLAGSVPPAEQAGRACTAGADPPQGTSGTPAACPAPAARGKPGTPAGQGKPGTPAGQGTPDTPAARATPDTPAARGTPDIPAGRATPDIPAGQGTPDIPAGRATPGAGAGRATPGAGAGRATPGAGVGRGGLPGNPTRPGVPAGFTRPGMPASAGRRPGAGGGPPTTADPQAAASRFVGVCVEVLNGFRPVAHLRTLTTPFDYASVTRQLTRRAMRIRMPARRPRTAEEQVALLCLRVCELHDGVAEAAAVLHVSGASWAVALRFERRRGNWLCTLLQVV